MSVLHENKSQPAPIPRTKIVEAFGLRKCPKLVEQVACDDLEVRNNALAVLSEEFRNPLAIQGCAQAGIIKVLGSMVVDPDFNTRLLSSKALAIAALDANGLSAILDDEAVGDIFKGLEDPSEVVRGNVYECLCNVTRTTRGIEACVTARVPSAFVNALQIESDEIKPVLLRTIYNIASSQQGLADALYANGVAVCIDLLFSTNTETRTEAARALGYMCYDEDAKKDALECNAVESLLELLMEDERAEVQFKRQPMPVLAAASNALMAVTSTDEGKRRVYTSCGGNGKAVEHLGALLYVENRVLRMNILKVIANIAVYPPLRKLLLDGHGLVTNLNRLRESGDSLMEKHASIALAAVDWIP